RAPKRSLISMEPDDFVERIFHHGIRVNHWRQVRRYGVHTVLLASHQRALRSAPELEVHLKIEWFLALRFYSNHRIFRVHPDAQPDLGISLTGVDLNFPGLEF